MASDPTGLCRMLNFGASVTGHRSYRKGTVVETTSAQARMNRGGGSNSDDRVVRSICVKVLVPSRMKLKNHPNIPKNGLVRNLDRRY